MRHLLFWIMCARVFSASTTLSTLAVVLMDSVDVLLQQNWEHVRDVFTAINRIPTTARDTDFSRVREWNLAGLAKYFRQVGEGECLQ